jgi:predicted nucleic acid-binding protein
MKVSYLVDTDWIIDQRMIGDFDLLIACTWLCHDLTLLTNNVGHFERIEGLRLLSISK